MKLRKQFRESLFFSPVNEAQPRLKLSGDASLTTTAVLGVVPIFCFHRGSCTCVAPGFPQGRVTLHLLTDKSVTCQIWAWLGLDSWHWHHCGFSFISHMKTLGLLFWVFVWAELLLRYMWSYERVTHKALGELICAYATVVSSPLV